MAVSEVLMKPGGWTLRLVESTPKSVLNALDWIQTPTAGFGHVFIYKAPIRPALFSDTNLRALALYAGILRERPDTRTFGGPGMVAWLGDEDDKGDILETAVTQTAATLSTWVTALRPVALSAGTVLAAGSHTATFQWITRRAALDAVCAALGYEYRVNPAGTLDANTVATLYGSTPTGFVTRNTEERTRYTGLRADLLETGLDLVDYTTKVRAITKTGLGTASGAATPYRDINGNAVIATRVVEAREAEDANAAATALINRFSAQRKSVRLSTDTYALHGNVKLGESVYVYDPRTGLVDTANQVPFGGEMTYPVSLRIYGIRWPIREGMGVLFRNGAGTWTDLTNWVEWEHGSTTLDVGGYARTLDGDPTYIGSARIVPAVEEGRWVNYTSTRIDEGGSLNIAHTVQYARYRRTGSTVHCEFSATMTAASGGAGFPIVAWLPPGLPAANVGNMAMKGGIFAVFDVSAVQVYLGAPTTGAAGTSCYGLGDTTGAAAIGATPNFALAVGDQVSYAFTYETTVT